MCRKSRKSGLIVTTHKRKTTATGGSMYVVIIKNFCRAGRRDFVSRVADAGCAGEILERLNKGEGVSAALVKVWRSRSLPVHTSNTESQIDSNKTN